MKGEIFIKTSTKIPCLETISQVCRMCCTLKHFKDSVWASFERALPFFYIPKVERDNNDCIVLTTNSVIVVA